MAIAAFVPLCRRQPSHANRGGQGIRLRQHSPCLTVRRHSTTRHQARHALRSSELGTGQEQHSRAARGRFAAGMASTEAGKPQSADGASTSEAHGGGAPSGKKRLAVFVSGGGSNMRAIHAATLDGRLPASVEV